LEYQTNFHYFIQLVSSHTVVKILEVNEDPIHFYLLFLGFFEQIFNCKK